MPQTATIKSLPAAFAMMRAMRAEGVEWGEDYRASAGQALAALLEGRIAETIAIGRICVVADRGMISAATAAALEQRRLLYLLATRERTDKMGARGGARRPAPYVPLTIAKRG
jgi:hypothetical protein